MNIWNHPNMRVDAIERRSGIGHREFYETYTRNSRPVIMTDAISEWPALKKWSLEYFRTNVGDHQVRDADNVSRSLTSCIDLMLASTRERPGPYIPSLRFDDDFPALYEDIEPRPGYWTPNWLTSAWVMPGRPEHPLHRVSGIEINLSGPDSTFPEGLHFDDLMTQTFVAQVHGTKELLLLPPAQKPNMYADVLNERVFTYSHSSIPVDRDFDLADFPLVSQLEPILTTLGPGDMLCNPPGWWHCVRANEPSIAVVTSVANGTIWPQVRRAVVHSAMVMHKSWKAPLAAAVYASYMTGYGLVRGIRDRVAQRI